MPINDKATPSFFDFQLLEKEALIQILRLYLNKSMDYLAYQKCLSNIGVFFFYPNLRLISRIFVYPYICFYLYICLHFIFIYLYIYTFLFIYILFTLIFVYIYKYICLHINIFVTWSKYFLSSPSLCCTKRPREVSEWSFLKLHSKKWFFCSFI